MEAARAMKVAIDAGASLDEMQRVLLKSVKPEDLFMAIRNAAQKEQHGHHDPHGPPVQQHHSHHLQPQQQQSQQQPQHSFALLSTPEGQHRQQQHPRTTHHDRSRNSDHHASASSSSHSARRHNRRPRSSSDNGASNNANATPSAEQLIPDGLDDPLTQLALALAGPPPVGSSSAVALNQRPPSHPNSGRDNGHNNYGFPPRPDSTSSSDNPASSSTLASSSTPASNLNATTTTTPKTTPSNSRPSSASENAALMHKLEAHAQKKQMLGSLVSQFQQLLSATNDPLDTMKERLQEMDALQVAHTDLEGELEQTRHRMAQVEDGAAKQVRGVLDTNAKLQQELVQLSRDLTQAESTLDVEKKNMVQYKKDQHAYITQTKQENLTHQKRNDELEHLNSVQKKNLKILDESKQIIIQKLQKVATRAEQLQDDNDELNRKKDQIGKHVWNLTDKLKSVSNELELAQVQKKQIETEMNQVMSEYKTKEVAHQAIQEETLKRLNVQEEDFAQRQEDVTEKYNAAKQSLQHSQATAKEYEHRTVELEREMKEMSNGTLNLRREIARLSQQSNTAVVNLENERKELLQLRNKSTELEILSKDIAIKNESLNIELMASQKKQQLTEEMNEKLREELRQETQSRTDAMESIETLRNDIDERNQLKMNELAALEDKNQKDMAHHALKEQERTKLDEEQKELFMQEQEQMKKEWLAQHENAMVSGGCGVWWCAVDELYFNTFTFFPVRFSLLPPFFSSLHPPPSRTCSAPNWPTPRPNPSNGKNGPNARKKA